jgi:hypothetical protein
MYFNKEIGKEVQEPIQINNVKVGETTQIGDISKPQPVSERDYEDDDQIPHKDLPHFSKTQLDKMTKKEIDKIVASTPLTFIDLEHKHCVLKTSDIYEAKKFLIEYIEVFSANDNDPGDAAHETGARIRLKPGHEEPKCEPTRPSSPIIRAHLKKAVDNMLKFKIIEPSQSPWGANVMLVPKKDGTYRCVCDLRLLNSSTIGMSYPLVRISDALSAMSGKQIFSVCDANQGFFQIPMAKEDKEKTAFRCALGSFQFRKMAMGLKNSGPIFQEFMDRAIGELKWESVIIYVDDAIIFSSSIEEHFTHLKEVFKRLIKHGIHLKAKKSELFRSHVSFLGHVVSKQGIQPCPKKIKSITQMEPKTKKEIHTFLGMSGYYRPHIKDYAKKNPALRELIKVANKFPKNGISDIHQKEIDLIKKWLTTEPILTHPQFDKSFHVNTDACYNGLGATLTQIDEKGTEKSNYVHIESTQKS